MEAPPERNLNPAAPPSQAAWRRKAYRIIFEADTPVGKAFDVGLIVTILASVLVVMLESVAAFRLVYGDTLRAAEWFFTILFTLEYLLRLVSVRHPRHYAFTFFGVVDLLAILPTYLSVLVPGAQFLLVIRLIRILRIFRVLKLVRYLDEANTLGKALLASRRKITVFVSTVVTLVTILGALMYLVEGGGNGFTSIPRSIYWAVSTLTTVGFGDITPVTALGQFFATIIMVMGYGIIAVPTGIVTVEIANATRQAAQALQTGATSEPEPAGAAASVLTICPLHPGLMHTADARFCRRCGTRLKQA